MTTGNSNPFAAWIVRTWTASSSVSSVVTLLRSSLSTRSATQARYSPSDPPVCSYHQRASSSTRRSRLQVVVAAPSTSDAARVADRRAISSSSCGTGVRCRASAQPRSAVIASSTAGCPVRSSGPYSVQVPPARRWATSSTSLSASTEVRSAVTTRIGEAVSFTACSTRSRSRTSRVSYSSAPPSTT